MTEGRDPDLAAQPEPNRAAFGTLRGRILLNSGIQLAGRAASSIGSIAWLWLLTRYLGRTGFGSYTFVTGYVALLFIITDLGSQPIAVREMARDEDRAARIAGQLFSLKLALSLATLALAVVVALVVPISSFQAPGVKLGILIAGIGLLANPFVSSAQALFQVKLSMRIPAVSDASTRVVMVLLLALLASGVVVSGRPSPALKLAAVLAVTSIGAFWGAAIMFGGARRLADLVPVIDRRLAIRLMRDAVPVAVVSVLGIVHYRIDVVVLSLMRSMATVGQYGVAARMLDVALGGLGVFMGLAFPVLSRRAAQDRESLQRAFQKSLDFVLIVGVGIAVLASSLAGPLVHLITPGGFSGAIVPLAVIAWAVPITYAETLFSQMIIAANRQLYAVPVILAATAANVGLNVVLIPHLGATAPALVTDVTEMACTVGLAVVMMRWYGFGLSVRSIAGIATAALLALGLLHALAPVALAVAVAVAGLAYAGILWALGVVRVADVRVVLGQDLG